MKHIAFLLLLAVCTLTCCRRQQTGSIAFSEEIDLHPSCAQDLESNGFTEEHSDSLHCWDVFSPTLTVYVPKQPSGQAILCLPGGSYAAVWYGSEGHNYAEWMTEQGITLAVLKYRMPNGHKNIPMADVRRAIQLMRGRYHEDWHVEQLGVMGFSAGGHLASTAATHWTSRWERPDFQVLFYPVITMDTAFTHMDSRHYLLGDEPTDEMVRLYSNELQVTDETPEAFIVLSQDDDVVAPENTYRYREALEAHGVACTMLLLPWGSHGWSGHPEFAFNGVWQSALSEWLKTIRK